MLVKTLLWLCLISSISAYDNGYRRRSNFPQSVMFGGYYGHPLNRRSYVPQGSMTAVIAGDAVATNSFAGPNELEVEEYTEESRAEEEAVTKRTPKRRPPPPQKEEDEEADDGQQGGWPFNTGKGGIPSYNAFFPIMIGGSSGGSRTRSNNDDGYYPGSATAIANSFSTGKGGVATSHATSFGDPYLASMFRNAMLNFGRNNNKPQSSNADQQP